LPDGSVRLIDWEYAGMCDPIMDISMYAIYSYYSQAEMDTLLRVYLQREPNANEKERLYMYAALGGYLWALWTEYKQSFGVEFGDYGMKMYRYAKEYYNHLQQARNIGV
jgi:thiamine kinase-like enzyme